MADAVLMGGVKGKLDLGDPARIGRKPLGACDVADRPGRVDIGLGDPQAVLVRARRDVNETPSHLEVGVVAGSFGGLRNGGNERRPGSKVLDAIARVQCLSELPPVLELGVEDVAC